MGYIDDHDLDEHEEHCLNKANKPKMLTEETLKQSKEFKEWVDGRVGLIHNPYHDSEEGFPAFIVLHSDMGKWTITRFWQSPNRKDQLEKIHVSVDHKNLSTEEVFKILLEQYSRGLA